MSVKTNLITILETAFPNYPVFLQGSINENEAYPQSFITIWTNYTEDNTFYDNDGFAEDWHFTVIFYSTNPSLVDSVPSAIRLTLKSNGFIAQGKGNDMPSDVETHTGWVTEYVYKEIL